VCLPLARAEAQTCPNPTPILCNTSVQGTTTGGTNAISNYSCISFSENGPERYYQLTLGASAQVHASVRPTGTSFDLAIALLPTQNGACLPAACIDGQDGGNPEEASAELQPGVYVIVVDGYLSSSHGPFELSLTCSSNTCVDQDGDGHPALEPVLCPFGTDCDDADASIHPGALDVCDDGIDQDCDGADKPCPYCGELGPIACDTWVQGTNAAPGSTQVLNTYACLPYPETSREVAYRFLAPRGGEVRVRLRSQQADLALAWIPAAYGCDPAHCEAGADRVLGPGEESLFARVEAGQEYLVVVDAWSQATDDFQLIVDCAACSDDDQDGHPDLYCGGDDCDDADPGVHPGTIELCNGRDDDCDGLTDEGFDLSSDPLHCGQCGQVCGGTQVCSLGECARSCAAGLVDCGRACVDPATNPLHCGACGHDCEVPHALTACQQGACQVIGCAPGRGDCNQDAEDGCETDLRTDPLNCSSCQRSCDIYPQGVPACRQGQCLLESCLPGYGNCNQASVDGCEVALQDNPSHCGECGRACSLPAFCYQGECTEACPDGLANCNGNCIPVDSDPRNCGGCGRVCQFVNATDPRCEAGRCVLGTCAPDFGDCNQDDLDGCEYRLGTVLHCLGCGDRCAFPNAAASCHAELGCLMGPCQAGYTDCNLSPLDGCEIRTASDHANCGRCALACGRLEACQNGVCVVTCEDGDDDGFASAACGGLDCQDDDRTSYPGAPERCDGLDNDCDGVIDEGFDADGDGYKDAFRCAALQGGPEPLDCDDSRSDIHPGAVDYCSDGVDQDCDGVDPECICWDLDGDGHADLRCGGDDCDDAQPAVHPSARELCNGRDDDCDGRTDEDHVCQEEFGCGCAATGGGTGVGLLGLLLGLLSLGGACRRR
jgi:hypothetical protein